MFTALLKGEGRKKQPSLAVLDRQLTYAAARIAKYYGSEVARKHVLHLAASMYDGTTAMAAAMEEVSE